MPSDDKRIKFSISFPSASFKRFIEKLFRDDDFFNFALESPVGAMKQCGVNVTDTFAPDDFIPFFIAISSVKEFISKNNIKDMNFENIFGRTPDINGSSFDMDMDRGICKDFKNNAFIDKQYYRAIKTNFQKNVNIRQLKEKFIQKEKTLLLNQYVQSTRLKDVKLLKNQEIDIDFEIDSRIRTEIKISGIDDDIIINEGIYGPLISPADLASITAKLDTFIKIYEDQNR